MSNLAWPEDIPIPKSFTCPITNQLMIHPVIDREGNSYEKSAIILHLQSSDKRVSPITNNRLRIR